ncbi:MAG: ABC1 kinase family protein [Polyangiales bacterium]
MSDDDRDPKRASRPPTGRLSRLARLTSLAPRAGALAMASLRKRLAGDEPDADELQRQRDKVLIEAKKTAEAMLKTLGEMKGLPLKLGQMASYIDGLAPPGYESRFQEVLQKLQAKAPPLSPEAAVKVIAQELSAQPTEVFAEFESEPFAAASIGQVHRATLHSGERVAVKVQYPGIDVAIENDLKTVALMEQMIAPVGRRYQTKEGLAEIREVFTREIDYTYEAQACEAFRDIFQGEPTIVIPRVHHSTTTKRVLTSQLLGGMDYDSFCKSASPDQRTAATVAIWTFMFRALYERGILYADPHPGNYRFLVDEITDEVRIGFLDFGCVRVLSDRMVSGMKQVLLAKIRGEEERWEQLLVSVYGFDPNDEEGWPVYKSYTEHVTRPLTIDAPFAHTRQNARDNVAILVRAQRKMIWKQGETLPNLPKPIHMPVEHTFVNRLQWGLASVLAGMEAPVNFHRLTMPWLLSERRVPRGMEVPEPR